MILLCHHQEIKREFLYPDCGDGYTNLYVYENSWNLNTQIKSILLY